MMSQFHQRQRLLLLPFLLILLTTSTVNGCGGLKLTLERCSKSADCAGHDPSDQFPTPACIGRDNKDELAFCPNKNVDLCVCYPTQFKGCNAHSECPDEQFCAISPRTGNQLCIGCLSYKDADIGFVSIDQPLPRSQCPNRRSHPPCGRTLDYCNGNSMPCESGKDCVLFIGADLFECGTSSVPCLCSNPVNDGDKTISVVGCKPDNKMCGDERESCAHDTKSNLNYCASCDAIANSPFLLHLNPSKCDGVPERKSPARYDISPNGRSFDICESDVQCTGERKCVSFRTKSDGSPNIKKFKPCPNSQELCFCKPEGRLRRCKSGEGCTRGESCITSENIGVKKRCVSNGYIQSVSSLFYEIEGKYTGNGNGRKLSGDSCRFDWNCKSSRRCTHITETWGGCAGRDACVCQQLDNPECFSDGDCKDSKEVCVNYIDGKSKAICMSKATVNKNSDFLKPVGFKSTPPTRPVTGNGLTGDDCLDNSDCVDGRSCQHKNENGGGCEGRNWCHCIPKGGKPKKCKTNADCRSKGEICTGIKDRIPQILQCESVLSFNGDTAGLSFKARR